MRIKIQLILFFIFCRQQLINTNVYITKKLLNKKVECRCGSKNIISTVYKRDDITARKRELTLLNLYLVK